MKRPIYILFSILLGVFFYWLIVSLPQFAGWFHRFILSEKYLLITNSWKLSQFVFPRWGIVQVFLIYIFSTIGFFVVIKRAYIFFKKKFPFYLNHKKFILSIISSILISFVVSTILASYELWLRSCTEMPNLLIGEKLTRPCAWKQQNCADERGMNMIRADYQWNDTFHYVNAQGFLSETDYTLQVADSIRKMGKKIAFIIGDSFVEGFTSGTWNQTFSELMKADLREQYVFFGFGIGGTDPLDYKLRAQKFVPEIKPDCCIICFCGNNDIMEFDRVATPYIPMCWAITNTFFYSNLYNQIILPTPDSLYNYLQKNRAKNRAKNIIVKWLCHELFTASLLYSYFNPWLPVLKSNADTCEASYRNLKTIKQICEQNSVHFQIAFIPDKNKLLKNISEYKSVYGNVFKDLIMDVYFPSGFTKDDFGTGNDIHFNDKGNRKFADFIEGIMTCNN